MTRRKAITMAAAVCVLAAGCGGGGSGPDLSKLDVGTYSTTVRVIGSPPSLPEGVALEGIRMSDVVADTSQFDSPLNYLWHAGPILDTASIVPIVGAPGKTALDQHNWVAGYRVSYADTPQPHDGAAPPSHVELSIMLLRFPDDAAARKAASALEFADWTDFAKTIAAPLPKHPEIAARYIPGAGTMVLVTPIGPFVLRVTIEAPPGSIKSRVNDVDAVVGKEVALLREFAPTPVSEIPRLPHDRDGLLARMVATNPTNQPPPSPTFAVYGPTGALRDQSPTMRADKLYEKWGVDRFAVSGSQQLYRLRDNDGARDMSAEFTAEASGSEHEIDSDPNVPNSRCFKANAPTADVPGFACRLVFDNVFTVVRADTASAVREMTAAQYVLLATR